MMNEKTMKKELTATKVLTAKKWPGNTEKMAKKEKQQDKAERNDDDDDE